MNELMIYQVFPLRALTDGQPSHGILEMIDWIPHIKKLGMNAVYFSPVFSSSDHGYDTKDYQEIDERLGTNEDFKKMCDAMHEEGIQVILDGVFNHVASGHLKMYWKRNGILHIKIGSILILMGIAAMMMDSGTKDGKDILNWSN